MRIKIKHSIPGIGGQKGGQMFIKLIIVIMLLISLLVHVVSADEKVKLTVGGKTGIHDCGINHSVSSDEPSKENLKLLSAKAEKTLQLGDIACAMFILKLAANMLGEMKSGQDRSIAGYEIKDVVSYAIKDKKLTDAKIRTQAVYLALQSITPTGEVLPDASPVERINDTSFLFHITNLFRQEGNVNDASETFLTMLRISGTIEKSKIPYGSYDITLFTEWLLKQSAFLTIIRVLKTIPEDDNRKYVVTNLVRSLPHELGPAGHNTLLYSYLEKYFKKNYSSTSPMKSSPNSVSFNKPTTLRFADDAEQLMAVLSKELANHKNTSSIKKKNGTPSSAWKIKLHRFIWQSYLVAGEKQDAQQKLTAWISAIRELDNRVQRVRAMIEASRDIYQSNVNYQLAISLLNEAENEANLLDDSKFRIPELEGIARLKAWMKLNISKEK